MFFDTHIHLDWWKPEDWPTVVNDAVAAGVSPILTVGRSVDSSAMTVWAAQRFAPLYSAVGIHPLWDAPLDDASYSALRALTSQPKVIAIGEVGISLTRNPNTRAQQDEKFRRHIQLAREVGKPLVVHNDPTSGALILQCLKEEKAMEVGAVLHSTMMPIEEVRPLWEIGMFISISAAMFNENYKFVEEVARQVPQSQLVIETDSAGGAAGRTPVNVKDVAAKVAELRGISIDEVAEISAANARRLFRLPPGNGGVAG